MRLSIGYICPFPIPLERLAEMEEQFFQAPEEQLKFGYNLYTVGADDIGFLPPNLTQETVDTAHYIHSLDNSQKQMLGLAILIAAGDRLLDRTDPAEPDLAALPD
jgi:hypothetical protein